MKIVTVARVKIAGVGGSTPLEQWSKKSYYDPPWDNFTLSRKKFNFHSDRDTRMIDGCRLELRVAKLSVHNLA